eukprot:COSAG06_NODE_3397_length_5394_cov_8.625590_2_plen_365_part_00
MRAKKCKTEKLLRVIDAPTVPDAKQYFQETDTDGSGSLSRDEIAQLYRRARGETLSKSQLAAAMREMDSDGSGEVDIVEFEQWWQRNGGDLEQHRARAFTFVFGGGVEVLVVAPDEATKQLWCDECTSMLQLAKDESMDVDVSGQLAIYLASGKLKHPRFFWTNPSQSEISWGKTMRAKKCKTEKLLRVIDAPTVPDAKQYFQETDTDGSGSLSRDEIAQLYRRARGETLSKSQLAAAMREMDSDGSGEVDIVEFEQWWQRNGGDLEQHRARAFTFVFGGGVEVLVVAPDQATKQLWCDNCMQMQAEPAPATDDDSAASATVEDDDDEDGDDDGGDSAASPAAELCHAGHRDGPCTARGDSRAA